MAEWFEDWFDTEEYLYVYRHRNEADARQLVKLILDKVPVSPGSLVLDMACGSGRHSIFLAHKGYNVTAVDLSQNLLKVAKKLAEEAGVKINFIRSDLRNFSTEIIFNLIINLFTSFGYFEKDDDNFRLFKNAYEHLTKPGYFVLDYFNKGYLGKRLVKRSEDEILGGKIIQERYIKDTRVVKNITIIKNGEERRYMESVRMYSKDELINAFTKTGFEVDSVFGDFNGNVFDLETSPRIIIIAKR